jgi:hypothetical protein
VYKYYTGDNPGELLYVLFDEVDVYDNDTIIEVLSSGTLLITCPTELPSGNNRWGWYGDKYEYINVLTSSGKVGWILRANIGKVED